MGMLFEFQLLILLFSQAAFPPLSFTFSLHLCPPDQNLALLQFKNTISLNNCSYYDDPFTGIEPRKIQSWKEGSDCCLWDGVSCDNVTGNVIGLHLADCQLCGPIDSNSSLFLLSHLQRLNLANNAFCMSEIPSTISGLASLTHLNLSDSNFSSSVPQEISHLSKLVSLDLSFNMDLSIENSAMKRLVQNMTHLRVVLLGVVNMSDVAPHSLLNISSSLTALDLILCDLGANHGGEFPVNIFQLQNLQWIRLSFNPMIVHFPKYNWSSPIRFLEVEGTGELPNSIGNLVSLKTLILEFGDFTGSIPVSIGNLTQINEIYLFNNHFRGELPLSLGKLQNLMELDLSFNNFTGQIPNAFANLTKLTTIDLSSNSFSGQIPNAFSNLTKLTRINLSFNHFSGLLPISLFNLTQPVEVDFSVNQLTGPLPSDIKGHAGFIYLDISYNLLKGRVPSWLFALPLLNHLDLSYNQLDGFKDEFQVNSSQLLDLDLSNNNLHGPIPRSLFELVHLRDLSLSSNNMTGSLDQEMISKLKHLSSLDLSYNNLALSSSSPVNYTFPMFESLRLSSCNLSEFPIFLKDSKFVEEIDLSDNKIHGQVPKSFLGLGDGSLTYLNLSHNFLTSFSHFPWNTLVSLDLRSNLLQGSLPAVLLPAYLFLSGNMFSGEIPPSFCNGSYVEILDMSNNNLNGTIPQCFGNLSQSVLDMRNNNFTGAIPEMFGECEKLVTLSLNGNKLEGTLPHSLLSCTFLEVLDVGNNKIGGEFPHWLGSLPNLQVLVLRSNKFRGPIANPYKTKFPFPMLRIIDVSHNEFTGPLPAFYFKNFKAMMTVDQNKSGLKYMGDDYYRDHMMVTMKGINIELVRILSIQTTIDLSNNNFSGEIPANVGKLKSLKGLNLSHNSLVGHIPSSMGSLTNLEWLDLSSNRLSEKIPEKLLDVTSLEVLNLSYNNLVGQIPVGKQFNTFSNDSYIGNLGLCGFPLSKMCNQQPPPPTFVKEQNVSSGSIIGFGWKVVALGYGCGVIFGIFMGYVVFSTGKPQWLVRLVEEYQPRGKLRRPRNGRKRHGNRRN
ncbi:hypothetical protein PTKIN_Ptkin14bG0210000 [Pterospermum kingtungense]